MGYWRDHLNRPINSYDVVQIIPLRQSNKTILLIRSKNKSFNGGCTLEKGLIMKVFSSSKLAKYRDEYISREYALT